MKKPRPDKNPNAEAPGEPGALPGSEAESFGPWLRRQREGREIDLREIAEASKIGLRYLQALEENRFDVLPADVFAKGFLRQYSKYVGLDAEEVITYFIAARQASQTEEEDEVTRAIKIRTKNTSRQRTAANRRFALVVLLVAAILLVVVWQLSEWQQREKGLDGAQSDAPAAVATPAPPPATSPDAPVPATPTDGVTPDAAAAASPGGAAAPGSADPANPAATAPLGDSAATAVTGSSTPPAAEPAPDPAQALATAAEAGSLVRVRLEFQANCWVEASVDGKRQISAMRTQGEAAEFSGDQLVELKLGDYQSAQVEVNGRPLTLVPDNNKSTVVRLRIDLPLVAQLTGVPLQTLEQSLEQRRKAGATRPRPRTP